MLHESDIYYTVHAPLAMNLMDPTAPGLHRDVLNASIQFAGEIGANVVVCHAGQRLGARDARHSFKDQLATERSPLLEAGETAGELGVTIAVENYYPELPIILRAVYGYSVRPSELAEQLHAVDHPAVVLCLDVGHAALAANAFGFDYFEECAAVAPPWRPSCVTCISTTTWRSPTSRVSRPSPSILFTVLETCTCRLVKGRSHSRSCSGSLISPRTSPAAWS